MMTNIIKAAVAQLEPVWLNKDASIDKAIEWIQKASKVGVRIIAFPEVFIPGYPGWIWQGPFTFGQKFIKTYQKNSITRNGPEVRRIAAAARENNIIVVMGFSEYDRGSLYMSQATFDETGALVSVRRKVKPTHVERSIFGDGTGADLQVHQLSVGRVGALNCWEHFQPLSKYTLFSMGEQIHIASWPNMSNHAKLVESFAPEVTNAANRTYAVEGQVFVLEAHNIISQEGVDYFTYDDMSRETFQVGGGCSRIWGPNGESLGNTLSGDEEGLLIADLDFDLIEGAKCGADPVGHYSRPDIFQLHINRTPARHVVEYWHGGGQESGPGTTHQLNGIPTRPVINLLSSGEQSTPEEQAETKGFLKNMVDY